MIQKNTKEKVLIIAFPSVGLVGAFATSYIVNQIQMKNIGELELFEISPSYLVKDGEVHGLCQIYKNDNVYAILAGVPLNSVFAYDLIIKSEEFAAKNGIGKIIIPRGLEIASNLNSEPVSYGLTVNEKSRPLIEEYDLPLIPQATILGTDAGVISALKKVKTQGLMVYTSCRPMFPDVDAIIKAVETISGIINVKLNVEQFEERLAKISQQNQKLIDQTKKHFEQLSEKPAAMSGPGIA